jgi:hypothetical protein
MDSGKIPAPQYSAYGKLEGSMQEYEFKICRFDGTISLTTTATHLNADAAISAASRLAGGKPFEVWDAQRCIYTSLAAAPRIPEPPAKPAA